MVFATMTWTAADVVLFPAASRAVAVSMCVEFVAMVVSHEMANGAAVSSAPHAAPSTKNCTPTTPTLSDASASISTIPLTIPPLLGAVMPTLGAVVSGAGGAGEAGDSSVRRRASTFVYSASEVSLRTCWPVVRLMPPFPAHWYVHHEPVFGVVINPV